MFAGDFQAVKRMGVVRIRRVGAVNHSALSPAMAPNHEDRDALGLQAGLPIMFCHCLEDDATAAARVEQRRERRGFQRTRANFRPVLRMITINVSFRAYGHFMYPA